MLSEIAGMIETAGLQVGACDRDFRQRCLRQNLGGDIVDRGTGDFMNEADVPVFAGRHARDDMRLALFARCEAGEAAQYF